MPTPTVVKAFVDSVNAGDTEAFLALFAADGVVDDWGSRYAGHARIREWSDRELIGAKATMAIVSSEAHGDRASVKVKVGGNGFHGPSRFAFTMNGNLVREMRISAD
jgi:hypothetical protein